MLENGVLAMAADDKKERKEALSALMNYGTIGIEMGLCLAIGLGAGYLLDRRFATAPIFTVIFMMFGLVAGMRRLYLIWKRIEKEDERDDSK